MKTNGAEFKAWLASDWGVDAWWDDYLVEVNGVEVEDYDESKIADTDLVQILSGVVFLDKSGEKTMTAGTHFRKWKKAQTHARITVEVPIDQLDAFKSAVKTVGAKVLA